MPRENKFHGAFNICLTTNEQISKQIKEEIKKGKNCEVNTIKDLLDSMQNISEDLMIDLVETAVNKKYYNLKVVKALLTNFDNISDEIISMLFDVKSPSRDDMSEINEELIKQYKKLSEESLITLLNANYIPNEFANSKFLEQLLNKNNNISNRVLNKILNMSVLTEQEDFNKIINSIIKNQNNLSSEFISRIIDVAHNETNIDKFEIVKNIIENRKDITEDSIVMFIEMYKPNTRENFDIINSIVEQQPSLSDKVLNKILSTLSLETVENISLISDILKKYDNISKENLDTIINSRVFKENSKIRELLIETRQDISEDSLMKMLDNAKIDTNIKPANFENFYEELAENDRAILEAAEQIEEYSNRINILEIYRGIPNEDKQELLKVDNTIRLYRKNVNKFKNAYDQLNEIRKNITLPTDEVIDVYDDKILCQILNKNPLPENVFQEMLSRAVKCLPYMSEVEFFKQVLENHSKNIPNKFFNIIVYQAIDRYETEPDLMISVLKSGRNFSQKQLDYIIEKSRLYINGEYKVYDVKLLEFMLENRMRISDKKMLEVLQDSIDNGIIDKYSPVARKASILYPELKINEIKTSYEKLQEFEDAENTIPSSISVPQTQEEAEYESKKTRNLSTKKALLDIYKSLCNPDSEGREAQTNFLRVLKMIDHDYRMSKGKRNLGTVKQFENNLRTAVYALDEADKLYMQAAIEKDPTIVETINELSPIGTNFGQLIKIALMVDRNKDHAQVIAHNVEEDAFEELANLPKHRTQLMNIEDAELEMLYHANDKSATMYERPTLAKDPVAKIHFQKYKDNKKSMQNKSARLKDVELRKIQIQNKDLILPAVLLNNFKVDKNVNNRNGFGRQ